MKRIQDCTISQTIWLNENNFLLELDVPDEIPEEVSGGLLSPGEPSSFAFHHQRLMVS